MNYSDNWYCEPSDEFDYILKFGWFANDTSVSDVSQTFFPYSRFCLIFRLNKFIIFFFSISQFQGKIFSRLDGSKVESELNVMRRDLWILHTTASVSTMFTFNFNFMALFSFCFDFNIFSVFHNNIDLQVAQTSNFYFLIYVFEIFEFVKKIFYFSNFPLG